MDSGPGASLEVVAGLAAAAAAVVVVVRFQL
jgi:hypothetical protein